MCYLTLVFTSGSCPVVVGVACLPEILPPSLIQSSHSHRFPFLHLLFCLCYASLSLDEESPPMIDSEDDLVLQEETRLNKKCSGKGSSYKIN